MKYYRSVRLDTDKLFAAKSEEEYERLDNAELDEDDDFGDFDDTTEEDEDFVTISDSDEE